ncbi:MAG: hypothetical protein H6680_06255 [Desulfobacteraceae bacterium]|nr:hypothetical protein [Desulfobacteraceae bacterium]
MGKVLPLCVSDLAETNKVLPKSLKESPLVAAIMAYEASRITGNIPAAE